MNKPKNMSFKLFHLCRMNMFTFLNIGIIEQNIMRKCLPYEETIRNLL